MWIVSTIRCMNLAGWSALAESTDSSFCVYPASSTAYESAHTTSSSDNGNRDLVSNKNYCSTQVLLVLSLSASPASPANLISSLSLTGKGYPLSLSDRDLRVSLSETQQSPCSSAELNEMIEQSRWPSHH